MKKNKKSTTQKKASAKRGAKRTARLKKTQGEKHIRRKELLDERAKLVAKENEEIRKILESRKI